MTGDSLEPRSPERYAVIGNPVAHSRSPVIHRLFAEQTGQRLHYGTLAAETDRFEEAVRRFHAEGGRGLNVTVPFKAAAYELAATLSERARMARAVNTLILRPEGGIEGDNTDGVGLINDLVHHHGFQFDDRHILILGAGGAVSGILGPLLARKPARVVISNRTPARARTLAETFAALGAVEGCGPGDLERGGQRAFDLIVNATSAGLHGQSPKLCNRAAGADTFFYDMVYGPAAAPFLALARRHGAHRYSDGLGMLVEQAAESFWRWRGVRPRTAPVIEQLRAL